MRTTKKFIVFVKLSNSIAEFPGSKNGKCNTIRITGLATCQNTSWQISVFQATVNFIGSKQKQLKQRYQTAQLARFIKFHLCSTQSMQQ